MKKYLFSVLCALLVGPNLVVSDTLAQDLTRVDIPGAAVFPESIAADSEGNLYVSSLAGGGIWRFKPNESHTEA